MYNALLSYAQMQQYLLLLTQRGLLQYNKTIHTFNITEKGLKFLEIYNKLDLALGGRGRRRVYSILLCKAVSVLKSYFWLPTTIRGEEEAEMDAVLLLLLLAAFCAD